jgi:hypothetical protein
MYGDVLLVANLTHVLEVTYTVLVEYDPLYRQAILRTERRR